MDWAGIEVKSGKSFLYVIVYIILLQSSHIIDKVLFNLWIFAYRYELYLNAISLESGDFKGIIKLKLN